MAIKQDRNFDSLIDKFEQRIYSSTKGEWRLKLLKEDLADLYKQDTLRVWDAGCGFAQISLWFAQRGHQLTLCDISIKMLQRAQQAFTDAKLEAEFHHAEAQTLATRLPNFDLVLSHAVLEWLVDPLPSLSRVTERVKPGGWLSLLFYNRNAMVYSNMLKGSWRLQHLLSNSYMGHGKRLTPPNPQYPHVIVEELEKLGFQVEKHTGIRVFHDYLSAEVLQDTSTDELFEMEYRYCRTATYRDMGRYIHLLCKRK